MTGLELGRLGSGIKNPKHDAPEEQVAAMLSKQDEIISKLNAILTAIEVANDSISLFTALDTASIKAQLSKIELSL